MEIRLSKNFTLAEMCKSNTATKRGIKNVPTQEHIKCLYSLVENVLQPLRDGLQEPIVINSGYRCPELNKAIGGARDSQHMRGEAADIRAKGYLHAKKIFNYIVDNLPYDQVILEVNNGISYWVHVSFTTRRANRKQSLTIGQKAR